MFALNPVLRGWAAYFRYAAAKRTFSYLGYYAWWRVVRWLRKKHPRLRWKQIKRRYFGKDGIQHKGIVLYNPAAMRVMRYRYRGAMISTPWNERTLDPKGARFRRTVHDDPAFLDRLDETLAPTTAARCVRGEPDAGGHSHVRFGGRRRGDRRPQGRERRLATDPTHAHAEPGDGQRLGHPLAQRGRRAGMRSVELGRQQAQLLECAGVIGVGPGAAPRPRALPTRAGPTRRRRHARRARRAGVMANRDRGGAGSGLLLAPCGPRPVRRFL